MSETRVAEERREELRRAYHLGEALEVRTLKTIADFNNPRQEWRRLFAELLGTFLLVTVAAGGGMMGHAFPGTISRPAAVVAPALMVLAIILFMGKVSGAHLNPIVSIAFALRREFPWWRVPGYIAVQLAGAALAAWFLQGVIHVSAIYGSNYPAPGFSGVDAMLMEAVLTFGLVSVILGTASGAQNVGLFGGIGVGGYIALAGLWGSPISGASMNPARTFGPDLVGVEFNHYWVYVAGPLLGMLVAVVAAFVLRGPGGDRAAAAAAQGTLSPELLDAKDQVLDAKHDVLDAKDDVLQAKDDVLDAKDDVLQAKDDVLDAKDDVLQEREGPSP